LWTVATSSTTPTRQCRYLLTAGTTGKGSSTRNITIQNSVLYGGNFQENIDETGLPAQLTIFVENVLPGDVRGQPPGAHRDILITGNQIQNANSAGYGAGIYVGSAINVAIENNLIESTNDYGVVLCNSVGVTVDGNEVLSAKGMIGYDITTPGCNRSLSSLSVAANQGCPGLYAQHWSGSGPSGSVADVAKGSQISISHRLDRVLHLTGIVMPGVFVGRERSRLELKRSPPSRSKRATG